MSNFPPPADGFEFRVTRMEWLPNQILSLVLDDPTSSVNVMNETLQSELERRLVQLHAVASDCRGLLVSTGKPKIFIAGADIKYIAKTADFTRDQVIEFCERGLRLYQAFAELPVPTVALVQGACLGGGFEFALALDWRIASDASTTIFGLPEVHLGLIPGWAATVRVPRLSSVETAMRRIGVGKNFSAAEALRVGLVDQLTTTNKLQEQGLAKLAGVGPATEMRRQTMLGPATRLREIEIGDSSLDSQTESAGFTEDDLGQLANLIHQEVTADPSLPSLAPQLVVELIARSASVDFFEACSMESQTMAEVYTSPTGQALVHAFLLNDRAKKSPGVGPPPNPLPKLEKIGIVGLGVMGRSIARLFVRSPWKFVLFDKDPAVRQDVARVLPSESFEMVESLSALQDCDAILENVYEQKEVKQQVLRELESIVRPSTFLLTNTSVIPITELASGLELPSRFCGLHFFNPIEQTKLAEIATHASTDPATIWVAAQLGKQLQKMVLVVGDGPGLVVNRLLMAMLNEAQRLLAEGYSIPQIDRAARGFGWRLGPFEILDVIGLKTALDAGSQIAKHLATALSAPPFLVPMIKAGRLGRHHGAGFYRYAVDGTSQFDPQTTRLVEAYVRPSLAMRPSDPSDPTEQARVDESLAHRMLASMLIQAKHIVNNGQVRDAAEIDLCCLLALGFPPHRGGLLYWLDHYPLGRFVEALSDRELAKQVAQATLDVQRFYPKI
ncbi:MAG: 3-hydroxyacyl-CoA dehydrogenase NAD-binding domain-containing protein [Pirellulaceae bacterium]|nr:3-hydroxyacyl-CoA dehydrogenase NAD-binding domain-containing protein [Pirellulaceae bacterium]